MEILEDFIEKEKLIEKAEGKVRQTWYGESGIWNKKVNERSSQEIHDDKTTDKRIEEVHKEDEATFPMTQKMHKNDLRE